MKDPRLLLALLGFAWLAWSTRDRFRQPELRALAAFVFAGFLGWALQSGIYRYAIALELLGALALALLLARLPRWQLPAMLLAFLLVSADTRRPDWNRVHARDNSLPRLVGELPPDAMVLTASDEPLGYLALALPDEVPMLGLHNNIVRAGDDGRLARRIATRVAAHRGPLYLAGRLDAAGQARLARAHGLVPTPPCLVLRSSVGEQPLCPLARRP
jgi:hypothetical protein